MNHSTVHPQQALRRSARWTFGIWLVWTGLFVASCGQFAQAGGCHFASAAANSMSHHRLDASLLGKWQYAGGTVYFLFHPVPGPCDGPGCRQTPEPISKMSVIPSTGQPTLSPAHYEPALHFTTPTQSSLWPLNDSLSSSPTLSGMLRPPC